MYRLLTSFGLPRATSCHSAFGLHCRKLSSYSSDGKSCQSFLQTASMAAETTNFKFECLGSGRNPAPWRAVKGLTSAYEILYKNTSQPASLYSFAHNQKLQRSAYKELKMEHALNHAFPVLRQLSACQS